MLNVKLFVIHWCVHSWTLHQMTWVHNFRLLWWFSAPRTRVTQTPTPRDSSSTASPPTTPLDQTRTRSLSAGTWSWGTWDVVVSRVIKTFRLPSSLLNNQAWRVLEERYDHKYFFIFCIYMKYISDSRVLLYSDRRQDTAAASRSQLYSESQWWQLLHQHWMLRRANQEHRGEPGPGDQCCCCGCCGGAARHHLLILSVQSSGEGAGLPSL